MNCNTRASEAMGTREQLSEKPVSERVVEAVADREGRDGIDLDPPLYNAINPEALDSLFETSDVDGRITFDWRGYRIDVSSNGSVQITEK